MEAILAPARLMSRYRDLQVPVALIAVIAMLVLPVPPVLLDALLSINLVLAITILLLTTYTKDALEFSVFPSLLLFTTLFRLALNVAAMKLILTTAHAGKVIYEFGDLVVGGNQVVGIILFATLVVIQFIVITSGAGRVAEVAARFTLDAMPGKQMSIDADLNAGIIDEAEARRRRRNIEREADFYGAMDGATKFVRGDAIFAIIAVLLNIVGGFIIGVMMKHMTAAEAFETYTRLTVGDGLVTQIPALIVSTATGIIVTRAASEENLGSDMATQLTRYPREIMVAAVALLIFGAVLQAVPMITVSLLTGLGAYALTATAKRERVAAVRAEEEKAKAAPRGPEDVTPLLEVEPIELEIGYGLIPLAHPGQGGDLLDRVTMIRKQAAIDLGLVVPPIRIRDN
ncbi:MAG TPA: flagellar biosynthesis protein FlhA, partial [Armatimonadota bacterium]|nr:flagellar biosynthesis protein FlhA [Armatimonadota bacterium]